MSQDITRRWIDEDEAKQIVNYPDPDQIPSSLKDRVAVELIVRAMCPYCTHNAYYYSESSTHTVECRADDCTEEFVLP